MKGGLTLAFVFVLTYPGLSMLGGTAHAWYSFDGFVQFPTKEGGVNEHAHGVQFILVAPTLYSLYSTDCETMLHDFIRST